MPAILEYNAGMKMSHPKQYTIRNVTKQVDAKLRQMSYSEGKSLNDVALEALARGTGVSGDPIIYNDLDSIIGSWKDDPAFDAAIHEQDVIDPKLWS